MKHNLVEDPFIRQLLDELYDPSTPIFRKEDIIGQIALHAQNCYRTMEAVTALHNQRCEEIADLKRRLYDAELQMEALSISGGYN